MRSTAPSSTRTTARPDRKSTRLNSSHTVIYTLSLHDALPIYGTFSIAPGTSAVSVTLSGDNHAFNGTIVYKDNGTTRSEEHTSELQSHSDLHSFPTRRSSDLWHLLHRSRHQRRQRHLKWRQPCVQRHHRLQGQRHD